MTSIIDLFEAFKSNFVKKQDPPATIRELSPEEEAAYQAKKAEQEERWAKRARLKKRVTAKLVNDKYISVREWSSGEDYVEPKTDKLIFAINTFARISNPNIGFFGYRRIHFIDSDWTTITKADANKILKLLGVIK
jgi:hypothetical protein